MSVNNERLMMLISGILDVDINLIGDDTSPEDIESWDSFNALLMVSDLESEFNVHFSMEEVYSITCVKDIRDALSLHNVEF